MICVVSKPLLLLLFVSGTTLDIYVTCTDIHDRYVHYHHHPPPTSFPPITITITTNHANRIYLGASRTVRSCGVMYGEGAIFVVVVLFITTKSNENLNHTCKKTLANSHCARPSVSCTQAHVFSQLRIHVFA